MVKGARKTTAQGFLSWLSLDGEVLVVSDVEAVPEEALDEGGDELEVHQDRHIHITQTARVVGWRTSATGRLGPGRVGVADINVHVARGARKGRRGVRLVVDGVAVGCRQAPRVGDQVDLRVLESRSIQALLDRVEDFGVIQIGTGPAVGVVPGRVASPFAGRPLQVDREIEGARKVEDAHREQEQNSGRDREFDERLPTLLFSWARSSESIDGVHQRVLRSVRAVAVVLIDTPEPNVWG